MATLPGMFQNAGWAWDPRQAAAQLESDVQNSAIPEWPYRLPLHPLASGLLPWAPNPDEQPLFVQSIPAPSNVPAPPTVPAPLFPDAPASPSAPSSCAAPGDTLPAARTVSVSSTPLSHEVSASVSYMAFNSTVPLFQDVLSATEVWGPSVDQGASNSEAIMTPVTATACSAVPQPITVHHEVLRALENFVQGDAKEVATPTTSPLTNTSASANAVHEEVLRPIAEGSNVLAQVPAGAGRIATCVTGILLRINSEQETCQALVIAATRPSAKQVQQVASEMGAEHGVTCHALVGGTSVRTDIAALHQMRPHVLVGTPGRIHDLIMKKHLKLEGLKVLVLQDGDELLSRAFAPQLVAILHKLPKGPTPQMCVFYAQRMTEAFAQLAGFVCSSSHVAVAAANTPPGNDPPTCEVGTTTTGDPEVHQEPAATTASNPPRRRSESWFGRSTSSPTVPQRRSASAASRPSAQLMGREITILTRDDTSHPKAPCIATSTTQSASTGVPPNASFAPETFPTSARTSALVAARASNNLCKLVLDILKRGYDLVGTIPCCERMATAVATGVLSRVDPIQDICQVLVLTSSRHAAHEMYHLVDELGRNEGKRSRAIVGGTPVCDDISSLESWRPHTVVGTPGRVHDLILQSHLKLDHLQTIALEDCAVLTSKGVLTQTSAIFANLPKKVQVCCFNAKIGGDRPREGPVRTKLTELLSFKEEPEYIVVTGEETVPESPTDAVDANPDAAS